MKKFFMFILLLMALTGCSASASPNNGETADTVNVEPAPASYTLTFALSPWGETHVELLNFAVEKFRETREDVMVKIISYSGDYNREAYSQIINTAIMSGGGEDIIDVNQLTWEKLADKNKLVDLTGYLTLPPDEIFTNIIDAYIYNGKRYTLPMAFAFKAYGFSEEFRNLEPAPEGLTLDMLLSLNEKYPNANLIESGGNENALTIAADLFGLDFAEYIDLPNKKVYVEKEKFISMLTKLKSIQEKLDTPKDGKEYILTLFGVYSPVLTHAGTLNYNGMFLMTNDAKESNFTGSAFMPAINANSKNQVLAGEFINFLLSEEIQSSPEINFSPVNIKAGAVKAEGVFESINANGLTPTDFDLKKNIEMFNKMAGQLTSPGIRDRAILNFIHEELERFFGDRQTVEQTVANLQSRLTTYLNE